VEELKKKWEGQTSAVFSTISSKTNTNQQYWDLFHLWEKKETWRQLVPLTLHLITVRVWPTMKQIKVVTRFVTQMEATREGGEVFDVGNREIII
jgi:hypothetical protein